jgi:hypothetical protein
LKEDNTQVQLVKGGNFVYRTPGRSPEEVNTYTVGIPVLAKTIELGFYTLLSDVCRDVN